jgi:hypothetical protein
MISLPQLIQKQSYLEWDEYKDLVSELEHHWFVYRNCVQNIKNTLARLEVI